ncbi:MAG: hypothetical protein EBZ75_13785 [Oxalobacteraceae bacterium]|nr:hypothetical protein [Oxalobacteraceae bacterium]
MQRAKMSSAQQDDAASLPCVPPGPLVFTPGCRVMPGARMVRFECKCGYTTQCCIMCYANIVSSGMNISDPVLIHKSTGSRHTYDMLMAGPSSKFAAYYRRSFSCHKCPGGSMLVKDGGVTWPALLMNMPGQCLPRPTNYPTAETCLKPNNIGGMPVPDKVRPEPRAASEEDEERAERRRREKLAREQAEMERINAELAARKALREAQLAEQSGPDEPAAATIAQAKPVFIQASFSEPRKTRVIPIPVKKNVPASQVFTYWR